MMTQNESMQEIVEEYRRTGEAWPARKHDIAAWAYRMKRWQMQPETAIDVLANQIGRAMREEFIIDGQGRKVRAKHAATVELNDGQQTLWHDIRTAPHAFMEIAFQQRRRGIVADCKQLKTDVDSYNENNSHGEQFQLLLDFRRDVDELEICA